MNLADAYPNSALSVGALMAIAFTMVIVLAIWLIMVFRADGKPEAEADGKPEADNKPEADSHPRVAEPAATSEDKHNDRGQAQAGRREGVSA
jgi:hypothetical protein